MQRLKCIISYDGTHFSGYQIQPNGRTVQEEIETVLEKIHKGKHIRIVASGRTDAGVHAKGQVIHFDSNIAMPEANWKKAINALLPKDVQVKKAEKVSDDFHSRYDVKEKEYRYFVLNTEDRDVFQRHFSWQHAGNIDVGAIQSACKLLEGKHDFSSFCSAKTDLKGDKIRTIYEASCYKKEDMLVFCFKGNGFLYNMVRILVGTLLEIGKGKRSARDIPGIIRAENRGEAGETAPPQGLFLWNVDY
ncbi:tRNA pseudouridine(38-40) synthase TruA [Sediminibacillus albus]|uniref:tRNA pseudouridine synthase A n=1 Tax=Sediminibacillus albus TaxID=407036 RepID=A0A1G9D148_9BACI|nr:tRNA pseudouridine(38-40) synthase TruA [Sediminibacillus albus]SDK57395.1 tRNA pseudouridine38-40 synthase [Sediminibacillus albus]